MPQKTSSLTPFSRTTKCGDCRGLPGGSRCCDKKAGISPKYLGAPPSLQHIHARPAALARDTTHSSQGRPGVTFLASPRKVTKRRRTADTALRYATGFRQNSIQNGKRKNSPDKTGLKQFSFLIRFESNFGGSVEAEYKAYCCDLASLIEYPQ